MADEKIIFSMNGVGKVLPHNNKVILKDIYLSFFYGAKIGIIGLNGSGKSTLLKIIAGVEKSYKGEVVWAPGYTVGYLAQEPEMDPEKTVIEVVQEGVQDVMDVLAEYNDISMKFMEPMDDDEMNRLITRQGELTEMIEHLDGWEIDAKLERAMDALQCPPSDALIKNLSGGERRRVALCRLLLQQPDVLLLDEPTNHLDTESIQWLEAHLQQYKGTVIAVTHDRYFLDNVAGWILELDRGEGIPWKGNYSSWLDQKTKRLALEEKQESKRRKTLERELEWVRMAPKARQAKQKARLGAYEKAEGPSGRLRETRFRRCQAEGGEPRDLHPQRTAPGQQGHPLQRRVQGLRRQGAVRAPDLRTPAGRHRGRHRPERRRQDHPLPPDHGHRAARQRHHPPSRSATP